MLPVLRFNREQGCQNICQFGLHSVCWYSSSSCFPLLRNTCSECFMGGKWQKLSPIPHSQELHGSASPPAPLSCPTRKLQLLRTLSASCPSYLNGCPLAGHLFHLPRPPNPGCSWWVPMEPCCFSRHSLTGPQWWRLLGHEQWCLRSCSRWQEVGYRGANCRTGMDKQTK